jgi:hypothetical protein
MEKQLTKLDPHLLRHRHRSCKKARRRVDVPQSF